MVSSLLADLGVTALSDIEASTIRISAQITGTQACGSVTRLLLADKVLSQPPIATAHRFTDRLGEMPDLVDFGSFSWQAEAVRYPRFASVITDSGNVTSTAYVGNEFRVVLDPAPVYACDFNTVPWPSPEPSADPSVVGTPRPVMFGSGLARLVGGVAALRYFLAPKACTGPQGALPTAAQVDDPGPVSERAALTGDCSDATATPQPMHVQYPRAQPLASFLCGVGSVLDIFPVPRPTTRRPAGDGMTEAWKKVWSYFSRAASVVRESQPDS
jgi:hypothetical protein